MGVPLVSGNFKDYKGCMLYALTLHFNQDVNVLSLTERAAERAYALSVAFAGGGGGQWGDDEEEETEEDEGTGGKQRVVFPWKEPQYPCEGTY